MTEICNKCKINCIKQGKHVTRKGIRQRYKCPNCGRTLIDPYFETLFAEGD